MMQLVADRSGDSISARCQAKACMFVKMSELALWKPWQKVLHRREGFRCKGLYDDFLYDIAVKDFVNYTLISRIRIALRTARSIPKISHTRIKNSLIYN